MRFQRPDSSTGHAQFLSGSEVTDVHFDVMLLCLQYSSSIVLNDICGPHPISNHADEKNPQKTTMDSALPGM